MRSSLIALAGATTLLLSACGGAGVGDGSDPGGPDAAPSGSTDGAGQPDAQPPEQPACRTVISYGNAWIHSPNHPDQVDTAQAEVTWDGVCTDDGANSYAVLSNGWKPYFRGHGACVLALDTAGCGDDPPPTCRTRVTYGPAWIHGANHPNQFDQVNGRLTWDRACAASGSTNSVAHLSNGWSPVFSGTNACSMSLSYSQCGGLYQNPVVPTGCPDPGVTYDGKEWVMVCTSGGAAAAFPIHVSTDLVHWTPMGSVFPAGQHPSWATGSFWAPEIHKVTDHYVVYFTAKQQNGRLAVGAASAASALGPFTDLGHPLVASSTIGLIDPSEIDAGGQPYLLWKVDGNAQGKPTPIRAQRLAADGLSLIGSPTTLITNDQPWEGNVIEGPWMVKHGDSYYLFYSGNSYANSKYAVGVARASSPMGPFSKKGAPILTSRGPWAGPGHCSVVEDHGDTWMVYHAWPSDNIGSKRVALIDRIVWKDGWPTLPGAPSSVSGPMP